MATTEDVIRYQAWDSASWGLEFDGGSPAAATNDYPKEKIVNTCQYDLWSAATWEEGSFTSCSDELSAECHVPLLLG